MEMISSIPATAQKAVAFKSNGLKIADTPYLSAGNPANVPTSAIVQLISVTDDPEHIGHTLLTHPDFIRNYSLGRNIRKSEFFSNPANEALHLSEKENDVISNIFRNIYELQSNVEDFSQDVMVSQIELPLNYSSRFYKRHFITRKAVRMICSPGWKAE